MTDDGRPRHSALKNPVPHPCPTPPPTPPSLSHPTPPSLLPCFSPPRQDLGLANIQARVRGLAQRLRDGLRAVPGVTVTDLGSEQCAIVSFAMDAPAQSQTQSPQSASAAMAAATSSASGFADGHYPLQAGDIKRELARLGFSVSVSEPESTRLDATARRLPDLVRASPHYYNTDAEIDAFVAALAGILAK